jgi:DNA-directed RNA polymerase subunit RPC12/RpoP
MSAAYKCGTCGVISDENSHLCRPEELAGRAEFCGSGPENIGQICEQMDQKLEYQCFTCGRPTDKPDLVCNPTPIR